MAAITSRTDTRCNTWETEERIREKYPDFPFAAAPTKKELQQDRAREKSKLVSGWARRRAPEWMKPPR
jgi:hypothetical protein